jgi:hypothetical protein
VVCEITPGGWTAFLHSGNSNQIKQRGMMRLGNFLTRSGARNEIRFVLFSKVLTEGEQQTKFPVHFTFQRR